MNVVIAIDSFKGSLSSMEAGAAARRGILRACPNASVTVFPIADGGEGTTSAILSAVGGTSRCVTVSDPLGQPITASYGVLPDGVTAVIETAAAAGLPLLCDTQRNPLVTTTYGVGEMILDAVTNGCRRVILGLGGSATNDGGVGMLEALGVRFLDECNTPIPRGAIGLQSLATIDLSAMHSALSDCEFLVACDVNNPLCGDNGCSAVFAPQKGAAPQDILKMDAWLSRYASLTSTVLPKAKSTVPGAGAAGGLGFACKAYLNATLLPGINLLIQETGLDKAIQDADLVITGEGRLDAQSMMGKVPMGIAAVAQRYQKPVVALAGCVTEDAVCCNEQGLTAFFPILQTVCTLEHALDPTVAAANLSATSTQVMRLINGVASL